MEKSGVRERRRREMSPDRTREVHMQPRMRPFRKVQIIYYLSRNGQLEHPHFMEVPHLPNQQLRLKDVIDRLTLLRGRGMPSLYSWSCKRSYKNGYVWNDLAENDVIYPAEGAVYVLKGSEIIEGCTDQFQHLQITTRKPRPIPVSSQGRRYHHYHRNQHLLYEEQEEEEARDYYNIEQEEVEYKGPQNHTSSSSNTPSSRFSRGVATDELDLTQRQPAHLRRGDGGSPPSSSRDKPPAATNTATKPASAGSDRFNDVEYTDQDPITRTTSGLLQLIACGAVAAKRRNCLLHKNSSSSSSTASPPSPIQGDLGMSGRKSGLSLHRGVLRRLAASRAAEDEEVEKEINHMGENPRFGNPHLEEEEYFSGSVVESMATGARAAAYEPSLKKSPSRTRK